MRWRKKEYEFIKKNAYTCSLYEKMADDKKKKFSSFVRSSREKRIAHFRERIERRKVKS
tara:strand:+ start:362 stop:538 length:177 start_codon:yes stop_codon:yes gene_type:complete